MIKNRIGILTKKTALALEKLSNSYLAPYELTNTQFMILMFLYQNHAVPIRQVDIEIMFSMTNPTVTGVLNNLEKKGLVQRIENPDDKRSKLLAPTEKALSIKAEICEIANKLEVDITSGLTSDERKQLIVLLNKILESDFGKER